jgi:hypothetical protein
LSHAEVAYQQKKDGKQIPAGPGHRSTKFEISSEQNSGSTNLY